MRPSILTLILWSLFAPAPVDAQTVGPTVKLLLQGRVLEGTPLTSTDNRVHFLGRDGKLWDFASKEATNFQKTDDSFQPYTHIEFRGALLKEFGRGFEVSGTGHYLVVHPTGQKDKWAPRFEELFRSFAQYFSTRGLPLLAPKFPLVAVVMPTQAEFLAMAARDGVSLNGNVLGYYSPTTNRILIYDIARSQGDKYDWQANAETIIHEATHQTAFNTGVHNRFSPPPRWAVEGLGTLFEARGVWNSRENTKTADRINKGRLKSFQNYLPYRKSGMVGELITSDRLFQSNADQAYAESWALTFYLAETAPRKWVQYLAKTAAHAPFVAVDETERLKDFTGIFGPDLQQLEAQYLRFLADLK